MKKYLVALCGILALPAFAEVTPVWYDEVAEYTDDGQGGTYYEDESVIVEEDVSDIVDMPAPVATATTAAAVTARSATPIIRGASTRAATRQLTGGGIRPVSATRAVSAQRPISSRTAAATTASRSAGANQSAGVTSRAVASTPSTVATDVAERRTGVSDGTVARAGTSAAVKVSATQSPLYISGTTSRVGVRSVPTSSTRASTLRSATISSTTAVTAETPTGPSTEELAQLTDFCKAQYYSCMDNFCDVLDDNQGRCSCSPNIKNYAKTEDALRDATEQLQDVAQKIQYIGLTADEIDTLFKNTEAEAQMSGQTDSTQLATDLNKIKKMIVEVKGGTSTTSSDTGLSLDFSNLLDFQFDSSGFDLSALFGGTSTTNSIANQRGAELYKTAAARCRASVLDSCKKQGVEINILTNGYDMEIDRQCIVYERALDDANTQMRRTVRNANSVLQKARLVVAQQKNAYDLRGCINALDSCMQDEFVCGTDYEGCLDPTGRYIINGEIVIGSTPGYPVASVGSVAQIPELYHTWNYGSLNAWTTVNSQKGSLPEYINATFLTSAPNSEQRYTDLTKYLQAKIGYHDDKTNRNVGMCVSVLNKCQDITYRKDSGKYIHDNNVIYEYLNRTLIRIKAKQDEIINDYAENCISDVRSCLSSQGASSTYYYGTSSTALPSATMAAVNACAPQTRTCTSVIAGTMESFTSLHVLGAALCGEGMIIENDASTMRCICDMANGYSQARDDKGNPTGPCIKTVP